MGSLPVDASCVIPFVGIALGVLKTCVSEATCESEFACCNTHLGVAGHSVRNGDVDIVTVTCIVAT